MHKIMSCSYHAENANAFGMNVISFLVVCVPMVHLKDNLTPTAETHVF